MKLSDAAARLSDLAFEFVQAAKPYPLGTFWSGFEKYLTRHRITGESVDVLIALVREWRANELGLIDGDIIHRLNQTGEDKA